MNEAETRAEYIDPKLKEKGWGEIEDSKILREFPITDGRIESGGIRPKPEIADYVLVYKNRKIGVIEAKKESLPVGEGVNQAKSYAKKLQIDYTYSTNGKEIYEISMKTGNERDIEEFPTPEELWKKTFSDQNEWKEKFNSILFEGQYRQRYYQEIAINNALDAIAEEKKPDIANPGHRYRENGYRFSNRMEAISNPLEFKPGWPAPTSHPISGRPERFSRPGL